MDAISYLAFWLTCICLYLVYLVLRNNSYLSKIPNPPGSIIFGHLSLCREPNEVLHNLTDLCLKHGGIFKLYIPPKRPSVLISDAKMIQQLLTKEKAIEKSVDYRFLANWLGTGLLVAKGEKWRQNRRILTPCFGRLSMLRHFITVFEEHGAVLVHKLEKEINNPNLDLFPLIKMLTMDVLCETSMGVKTDCQANCNGSYFKSIEKMRSVVQKRFRSFHKRFDFVFSLTEDYRSQQEALKTIDSFFYDIMNKRKREKSEIKLTDNENVTKHTFLDLLLQYENEGLGFTEQDVRDEVNTFTFGGHDTTATGLAFTLYSLARHPHIQEKVLEEQRLIFGDITSDISEVTYTNLQDMTYLEMVINEALRLYPPAPVIGRRLTADTTLGGFVLPKNINVVIFIYGCHRNPEYFPDPEKFIPERFEKNNMQTANFSQNLTFSTGPRNCIGKKYAMLQMKSCISKIVRNFELMPSIPDNKLELVPEITLASKNGIRISLGRRKVE